MFNKKYHSFVLKERNKQIEKQDIINYHPTSLKTQNTLIRQVSLFNTENGQLILNVKGDESVILKFV